MRYNYNHNFLTGSLPESIYFDMTLQKFSISTALDARLETRVESTTELRLRLMSAVDSEVLSTSLRSPIEVSFERYSLF